MRAPNRSKNRKDKIPGEMECPCIRCRCLTNLGAHDITGFCRKCGDIVEAEQIERLEQK